MFLSKKHFIGLLLIFINQVAFGQSLQDLWEKTASHYKGFDLKKQQILMAKQDSLDRLIKYRPQVQVQAQQGLSSLSGTSGTFLPLPGIVNSNGNASNSDPIFNHFLSSTMNWDIVNFGKKQLDKEIGRSQIQQSQTDQRLFEIQIQQKLAERYLNYQYLQVLEDWFNKHNARYQSILQLTIGLAKAGVKPGADSLLAQSALNQVHSNLTLLEGQAEGAKFLLHEFTGETFQESPYKTNSPFLSLIDHQDLGVNLHPKLLIKDEEANMLALQEKKLAKGKLPRIMLLGGLASRSSSVNSSGVALTDYGQLYDNFANNYYVGLGMTWSLQDLWQSNSKQRSSQLQQRNVNLEKEMINNELSSQLQNVQAQLHAAVRGIDASNKSRIEAEEAYQLYKARYEGGLINLSELLQVQDVLLQTEKQNLNAYMDYWKLYVVLSYHQADFNTLFHHF
ncbi:hypothetical protein GCM10022216_18970 [Sphingobacterium kyonggiense]|uniref:Outer membrane protein TolC n=1 Tax=Sphingobacterium kyonggiense TaxID=714075 RepID=A0ABP7YT85_9SPHI